MLLNKVEKIDTLLSAEQVVIIAELLETNKGEPLALWLADQITAVATNG
jgi:hypothetical protein